MNNYSLVGKAAVILAELLSKGTVQALTGHGILMTQKSSFDLKANKTVTKIDLTSNFEKEELRKIIKNFLENNAHRRKEHIPEFVLENCSKK